MIFENPYTLWAIMIFENPHALLKLLYSRHRCDRPQETRKHDVHGVANCADWGGVGSAPDAVMFVRLCEIAVLCRALPVFIEAVCKGRNITTYSLGNNKHGTY